MFFPGRLVFSRKYAVILAFTAILASGSALAQTENAVTQRPPQKPPVVPAPVEDLLFAQPFELADGYRPGWPPDAAPITSGTIIVIRADPGLTEPRQAPTPILYAGDRMVHTLNTGRESGVLIGIVPGAIDLAGMPIWFGPPRIPGTIDEKTIDTDREAALEAGIRSVTDQDVEEASRQAVRAPDLATLLREDLAELVLEFAPEEKHLAAKWRLPEVGPTEGSKVRP